jgi:hypothetical protein
MPPRGLVHFLDLVEQHRRLPALLKLQHRPDDRMHRLPDRTKVNPLDDNEKVLSINNYLSSGHVVIRWNMFLQSLEVKRVKTK